MGAFRKQKRLGAYEIYENLFGPFLRSVYQGQWNYEGVVDEIEASADNPHRHSNAPISSNYCDPASIAITRTNLHRQNTDPEQHKRSRRKGAE